MKKETLTSALIQRKNEVFGYQINIDNYNRAIRKISDPDLLPFKEQLEGLLSSEILEQKKAQLMLDVIKEQLEELE